MSDYPEKKFPVELLCTVVPGSGDKTKQQFSIVLTPYIAPEEGDTRPNWSLKIKTDVSLTEIPKVVSTNEGNQRSEHSKFVLFFHIQKQNKEEIKMVNLGFDNALDLKKVDIEKICELWEKVFDYESNESNGNGFEIFHDVLKDPHDKKLNTVKNHVSEGGLPEPLLTQSFNVSNLSEKLLGQRRNILFQNIVARTMTDDLQSWLKTRPAFGGQEDQARLEQMRQILSDMANKPFSSDYLANRWLDVFNKIFLYEGTDSAFGKLSALVEPSDDKKFKLDYEKHSQKKFFDKELNKLLEDFGGALAKKYKSNSDRIKLLSDIANDVKKQLNQRNSWDESVDSMLIDLLTDDFLPDKEVRTAKIKFFGHEVERYYDAVSFERPKPVTDIASLREEEKKELRDGVRRKIAALRSHPTLSKCLRLIHDFEVVLDAVEIEKEYVTHISAAFVPYHFTQPKVNSDFFKRITKTAVKLDSDCRFVLKSKDTLIKEIASDSLKGVEDEQKDKLIEEIASPEETTSSEEMLEFKRRGFFGKNDDRGLLDMSTGRFELHILDASQATRAMQSSAQSITEKKQTGAPEQYTSFDLPHLRSRGIELLDNGIATETTIELAQARVRQHEISEDTSNVLYAEQLQFGMRIDILRYSDSGDGAVYSPSHARRVYYPQINTIFNKDPNEYFHPFPEYEYRDEGFTAELARQRFIKEGNEVKLQSIVSSRVMLWTGEPLGIPNHDEAQILDKRFDLPIDIVYLDPIHKLPALREKHGYRMVCRPRFINGDGVRFLFGVPEKAKDELDKTNNDLELEEAKKHYLCCSLPRKDLAPFTFTPPDVIGAPTVLYLEDDPNLLNQPAEPVLPDKLHTVVLRSYVDPTKRIDTPQRAIIPPNIIFDQAEQQGQFDNMDIPVGDPYMESVEWDHVAMTFPVKDASYKTDKGKVTLKKDWDKQDKGPFLRGILNTSKGRPNFYFKDQRAKRLGLALEHNGRLANSKDGRSSLVFEPTGKTLDPIILSFYPENELAYGSWVEDGLSQLSIRKRGRRSLKLDHLAVHLVPGAELELNLFCPPKDEEAYKQNLFVRNLVDNLNERGRIRKTSSNEQANSPMVQDINIPKILSLLSAKHGDVGRINTHQQQELNILWHKLAMEVPLLLLNAVEKISVIHAVQKPLLAPSIRITDVLYGTPTQKKEIRAFRIARRKEGPEDWKRLIENLPKKITESENNTASLRKAWFYGMGHKSEEEVLYDEVGSTIGYFIGEVAIDRNTTGSLKCEMLFRDVQSEVAKVKDEEGNWQLSPKIQTKDLFLINNIAKEHKRIPEHIDLAFDDQGKPRALSYDFGTKARRIALRLIATSRFAEFYSENNVGSQDKEADKPVDTALSFSEIENASHDELSQSLKKHNCPRIDHETVLFEQEFWVKSTNRPPKPNIRNVSYRFSEKIVARSADSVVYERSCHLRVQLGDYCASGEGELIALILYPPKLVSDFPESCLLNEDVVESEHKLSEYESVFSSALRDWNMNFESPDKKEKSCDEEKSCDKKEKPSYESRLGRSVTAWGTDPTTSSGFLEPVILPSQFAGYSMKKSSLKLPLSNAESDLHDVAVIAFEPKLSKGGEYYVDIDVDATRTDSPFLRCVFARCQLQSLPGENLELSLPEVVDPIQLPPKRRVEFHIDKEGGVDVSVTGVGYTRRSPAFIVRPDGKVLKHCTDTPLMNFKLMRRVGDLGTDSFVQIYDELGYELSQMRVIPYEDDAVLNWVAHFKLPSDISPKDIRLSVFESELNVPDIDENLPSDPRDDFVEVVRPFACDIFLVEQELDELEGAK